MRQFLMFLQFLAIVFSMSMLYGSVSWVRTRARKRRAATIAAGGLIDLPVRMRGVTAAYPAYWSMGWLNQTTARWRPRRRWGIPVSLAGVRVTGSGPVAKADGTPQLFAGDVVMRCVDACGDVLLLASYDDAEATLVRQCLARSATAAAPGDVGTAQPPDRAALRWLRQHVPLTALVLLVGAVAFTGYMLVPLLTARQVDAVVVLDRGPGYLCDVAWTDPVDGTSGGGSVDCQGRQVGGHLPVQAMGWPRNGTAEDLGFVLVLSGLVTSIPLMMAGFLIGVPAAQRRGLRRSAPTVSHPA
ncbi:MAG TPA: hypothetical protein VF755_26505 [Catenuloplanes sp.]|jgi:hypothetical protein